MVSFGILRVLLIALAISAMLLAPEPQARTIMMWPSIVPTLIAPAVAPLIFLVLIVDLVMSKIMASGESHVGKKRRARRIMLIDALAMLGITYAYLPFFLALGR